MKKLLIGLLTITSISSFSMELSSEIKLKGSDGNIENTKRNAYMFCASKGFNKGVFMVLETYSPSVGSKVIKELLPNGEANVETFVKNKNKNEMETISKIKCYSEVPFMNLDD